MSSLPSIPCSGRLALRFNPFSRDPFTDIGRTIPEFRSVGLPESKKSHGFSVDKKNVFEIDGEAAGFLFQYAPKHIHIVLCNPSANAQDIKILSDNNAVNSAAHSQPLPGRVTRQRYQFFGSAKRQFHERILGTQFRRYV